MSTGRSDMNFNDPLLSKLDFCINKDFTGQFNGPMEVQLSMHTQKVNEDENEQNSHFVSSLEISVGESSPEYPFYCEIEMVGEFYLNKESDFKESDFAKFNTAAILYSYARPIISDTISKSGFPPYNLPFMNFSEESLDMDIEHH